MSSGMPGTLDAARTPYSLESKQVCWNLTSAPWLPSTLLELTVELLPTIEDNVAVDLIEQLAVLVVERDERIRAQREVQSVTLGELHVTLYENERLRDQVITVRETLRQRKAEA